MNRLGNKFGTRSITRCVLGIGGGLRRLTMGVLLGTAVLGSSAVLATDEADLIEDEGVVQEVSLAAGTVLISGFQYRAPPHADVQIRGSASSIAGLVIGMKVRFLYETYEGLKAEISAVSEGRELVELEQLPDNIAVQQH